MAATKGKSTKAARTAAWLTGRFSVGDRVVWRPYPNLPDTWGLPGTVTRVWRGKYEVAWPDVGTYRWYPAEGLGPAPKESA